MQGRVRTSRFFRAICVLIVITFLQWSLEQEIKGNVSMGTPVPMTAVIEGFKLLLKELSPILSPGQEVKENIPKGTLKETKPGFNHFPLYSKLKRKKFWL